MKISYAITVCNEFIELQRLITCLFTLKRPQDEIVVQMDLDENEFNNQPDDKKMVFSYLMKHQEQGTFRVGFKSLDGNFANFKNNLTELCTGDYIFQLDADEYPDEFLVTNLPNMLESNLTTDVFMVPRINTVDGLTNEHINKWNWRVNEHGWINFPDYQWRLWKNKPEIKWINKVHERLDGYSTITSFPELSEFCLYHPKTIDRQERQNRFYETI